MKYRMAASSTWRPSHPTPTQDVHMKMWHGLAGVGTVIDDHAEAGITQALLLRDDLRDKKKMPEQRLILRKAFTQARDHLLRNDEKVHRRLGLHIEKCGALLVLVDDSGWNLAGDNLLKDGTHKGARLAVESGFEQPRGLDKAFMEHL
jgi:hypothetical protein